jgi:polar amino acid transport system substrate-binding protein
MAYITDTKPVAVSAMVLRPRSATSDDLENVAAVVRYENGSIGNLLYLTQGGAKLPKEIAEIFGGGMTARLENFEALRFYYSGTQEKKRFMRGVDKGQRGELESFVESVRIGSSMPIPVESLIDTTLTTLAVMESVRVGKEILLSDYHTSYSEA